IALRPVAVAALLVAAIGIVLVTIGRPGDVVGGAPPPPAPKDPPAPAKEPVAAEKVAVRGTAVDADGKPVAHAPVRLWSFRMGDKASEPRATTDADGRFQFDAAPSDRTDDARVLVTPSDRPAQWL